MHLVCDEAEPHVQDRRTAIAPLEPRRQRLEQPRQHERQRLEPVDRPVEIDRPVEALLRQIRYQRADVVAARERLPQEAVLTEPCGQIGGGQRGELTERVEAPGAKDRDGFAVPRPRA